MVTRTMLCFSILLACSSLASGGAAQPPQAMAPQGTQAAQEPQDAPQRPGAGQEDAGRDRRIDPERLRAAERELGRRDPPIARVVAEAIQVSGSDPERAADLASRARLSALLPTLRVGVRRGQDLRLQIDADEDGRWTTDDDLTVTGSATFELDRLVFASQEVSLLREQRHRRAARRELIRTVVALYYERRRLLLERTLLGPGDPAHVARVAELTALLNAFTDGAFSRMMGFRR